MKEWQSQAHVKWECKYPGVIVPKYRKKDAHDKSRAGMEFAINRYCVWIYEIFCVDKPGREIIL